MKRILYMIIATVLVSCEAIPVTEFTDRPVVCCYLSEGEVPTLNVQKLIPFQGDAQFSDEDVDKLNITITDITTAEEFKLTNIGNGNYRNDELVPVSGHEYRLDFIYDEVPVTSTTEVPSTPSNVSFSATSIEVMGGMPLKPMSKAPQDGIEISWDNEEGDYYIIEGKTSSTTTILELDDDEELPSKSFKHSYTQESITSLSSSDFNYIGTYTVSVIHILYEYAVLSQGGSTTSTTLVDVKGNIDGGYGIFTGISSVSRNIKVSKGSSPF